MKIQNVRFTVTDWKLVRTEEHRGETGMATWKVFVSGNIRVRMVEYSAGYRGDHWCNRGHVALVMEGELTVELVNGDKYILTPGMSFQVGENDTYPHFISTEGRARIFVVD